MARSPSLGPTTPAIQDGLALGLLLAVLLGVTAVSVATSSIWHPDAPAAAAWCLPGETPAFHFGFADLGSVLGDRMGQPTGCEHGDGVTDDTYQETTTGVAIYHWCANTPTFSHGQEHWLLTSNGLEYWTRPDVAPHSLPIVRAPDLRHPCAP